MSQFDSTLRLNLLEILDYSKSRRNRKRYSLIDVLGQLNSIYFLAKNKPTTEQIADTIEYLLDRSLVETTMVGDVEMYFINGKGRHLLREISEGDDTAII